MNTIHDAPEGENRGSTYDTVFTTVVLVICDSNLAWVNPDEVKRESKLSDLGVTSLTCFDIAEALGERYDIAISDEAAHGFVTVDDIVVFILSELSKMDPIMLITSLLVNAGLA